VLWLPWSRRRRRARARDRPSHRPDLRRPVGADSSAAQRPDEAWRNATRNGVARAGQLACRLPPHPSCPATRKQNRSRAQSGKRLAFEPPVDNGFPLLRFFLAKDGKPSTLDRMVSHPFPHSPQPSETPRPPHPEGGTGLGDPSQPRSGCPRSLAVKCRDMVYPRFRGPGISKRC